MPSGQKPGQSESGGRVSPPLARSRSPDGRGGEKGVRQRAQSSPRRRRTSQGARRKAEKVQGRLGIEREKTDGERKRDEKTVFGEQSGAESRRRNRQTQEGRKLVAGTRTGKTRRR